MTRGLISEPDHGGLHLRLTELLANSGDTGKLQLQIKELKRLVFSPTIIQFYTARYHINRGEFIKARHLLTNLQAGTNRMSRTAEKTNRTMDLFKSKISVLLAQCHKELGEPEMAQDAYIRALSSNPEDLQAKFGWIGNLVSQGNTTGAIKEYRAILKQVPAVRPVLARLLITQNQRRPPLQREWSEVNELINQLADTDPVTVEVLRAEVSFAQGSQAAALEKLKQAQSRFPKSLEIRIAQTNMLGVQGRVDQALSLLDEAQREIGDQVDLRLERKTLGTQERTAVSRGFDGSQQERRYVLPG